MRDAGSGIMEEVVNRRPCLWINELAAPGRQLDADLEARVTEAENRLQRSATLIARLFPEFRSSTPYYVSALEAIEHFYHQGGAFQAPLGQVFVKCDHALPLAGSIKARGGFHEVLAFAEALAVRHQLIGRDTDLVSLTSPAARELFSSYAVTVGSTGNLGMSIGILSAALGFKAVVHMSSDAKAWKKDRLRQRGVQVVEHAGDYAQAVDQGRRDAEVEPRVHFVDDERSVDLFVGYAAAGRELQAQLEDRRVTVDAAHPLLVYLPCGVGGAPGGITYGLKRIFGEDVYCFFGEPVASPCMLVQLLAGATPTSVYDLGLDNKTEADGLAVGQASMLVAPLMQRRLAGVYTASDDQLFALLGHAFTSEGLSLEPSAAMAFAGPLALLSSASGAAFLNWGPLAGRLASATHVVWTTGGSLVPGVEQETFRLRAAEVAPEMRWAPAAS
jgi:D-serine dehydratase